MIIPGAQLVRMATSTRERSSLRVRNLKRETWSSRKASVLKSTGSLSFISVKFWTTAKKVLLIAINTIFSRQLLRRPHLEHELDKRHKAVSANMVNFSFRQLDFPLFSPASSSPPNLLPRCSDIEGAPGELLSVNNIEESKILTSELFLTGAFGSGNLPQTTFTSGISLAPEVWTWFGAG